MTAQVHTSPKVTNSYHIDGCLAFLIEAAFVPLWDGGCPRAWGNGLTSLGQVQATCVQQLKRKILQIKVFPNTDLST